MEQETAYLAEQAPFKKDGSQEFERGLTVPAALAKEAWTNRSEARHGIQHPGL